MLNPRPHRVIEVGGDNITVRYYSTSEFVVGIDSSFITLHHRILGSKEDVLPKIGDVTFDDMISCGLFGRVHLVDVSSEDPDNYWFKIYGRMITFERGIDYAGRPLSVASTPAMAELARSDYLRVKTSRRRDLCLVEAQIGRRLLTYRRYIAPLLGDRGKVSHLLVAVTKNLREIGPRPFDYVGARGLD